jgi:hypothetical protein
MFPEPSKVTFPRKCGRVPSFLRLEKVCLLLGVEILDSFHIQTLKQFGP